MAIDANNIYAKQVQLLVRVLPLVDTEKCFALKGGTAINLFYRALPRLSVDIDLLYIPMDDRETALINIRAAFSAEKNPKWCQNLENPMIFGVFCFYRLTKLFIESYP